MARTPDAKTIYADEAPNFKRLYEMKGDAEMSRMMGLSACAKMLRDNKVRPAYEMAAAHLLAQMEEPAKESLAIVVNGKPEAMEPVLAVIKAMNLLYLELDL
ncbi:MAG: hypothetical protein Tp138OMZ00d2C19078261_27 [Prokaryotic dsDNA virus sp.]|jgi:uncharacterized protein (DUF885 family)|nr:MAG: hypothetical protein Tp138OMZ00d2C19078261_27 [Prokaryotic dsDNA virus sp.]|tara:strand:- start:20603 stop:20908 length:306 start_codon:yes stop_codon:yes gene_type:complete